MTPLAPTFQFITHPPTPLFKAIFDSPVCFIMEQPYTLIKTPYEHVYVFVFTGLCKSMGH